MKGRIGAHRRWMLAASLGAAALGAGVGGNVSAGAAATPGGQCQVSLGVTVQSSHGGTGRAYHSTSGVASCTGSLGPWLMSGQTGWSVGKGTFAESTTAGPVGGESFVPTTGTGTFFAQAPRFTYFDAAMVTISGTYRLRQVNGALQVSGASRLLLTHKSPVASRIRIAGTATFTERSRGACIAGPCSGTLTLRFAVSGG